MTQELTQAQAVDVLIQAAKLAQSKGAFTLDDAALVARAIRVFVPAEQQTESEESTTEPTAEQEASPSGETVTPVLEKVQ